MRGRIATFVDEILNKKMSSHILYRLPNEKIVHQLDAQASPRHLTCYGEVGDHKGYVFAPFSIGEKSPILLIEADEESSWIVPTSWAARHIAYAADEKKSRSNYERDFSQCLEALGGEQVEKIVLSRSLSLRLDSIIDESDERNFFIAACNYYPQAYVALIKTEETGTWLVATPEVLIEEREGCFHTMALAATMQADEGEGLSPNLWSDSYRKEQRIVADYIDEQLRQLGLLPAASALHLKRAAHLVHLCTDFSLPTPLPCPLGDVVEALHPTPAVCGWPTTTAAMLLNQIEGHERNYYAGFSGPIGLSGGTHLFVTLRCMQLMSDSAILFAGGGLLPTSHLESEWIETQRKMKTMLRLLQ